MDNQPAPVAEAPKKKSFFRKPLGCLLSLFVGGLLFIVLLLLLGVWFAGSNHALALASKFVNQKSGGELKFAENDTNLFAGRVHYKGVELTNPSRFTDKGFVKINELKAVVDLPSALSDTIVIPEVTFDLGSVSIVGSDDWIKDNNAMDFKKAFVPESDGPKKEEPKTEEPKQESAGPKQHFRIGKLILRIDRLRALSHATTPNEAPKVIVDDSVGLNWEFTDVSDENIKAKVYDVVKRDIAKLGGQFAKIAAAMAVAELGRYTDQAAKLVGDYVGLGADKTTELTGKATEAVDKGLKSVTSGLGGLLGGDKKEEAK